MLNEAEATPEAEMQAPGGQRPEEWVRGLLREGLTTWGAGGKTAAGYGYFGLEKEVS